MDVPREVRIEEALTRAIHTKLPRLSLRVGVHLLAMHVSGFVLLATFLFPPSWAVEAYAGPDVTPAVVILAVLLGLTICHVAVQLPSALLGTLKHRRAPARAYGTALATAGVLVALLVWMIGGTWADWLDLTVRLALSLACYVALALVR
ncbi:hypothetical protein ACFV0Z_14900 [Streptomyces xiamenensis]|uniref:hypothetical protein n=1 Tax=Streptomyces xiamenensis TaxID=408015 RepID=UPI0036850530